MNRAPSFSDAYNLNYTISIAAAKSGYFGAVTSSFAESARSAEESSIESARNSSTESSGSASDESDESSTEFSGWASEEDGEEWEKEYQEILSEEYAQQEKAHKQKPPRSINTVRTVVSESSQASKFKLFKKRVSHIFQPGHKNKTDAHLMLVTSYSQHSGTSAITDYTPSTSAYIQNTGTGVKDDSESQIKNDEGATDISIQRKRRLPIFARIASPHFLRNTKPGRKLFENTVLKDKIPVGQVGRIRITETVSSSESDQVELQIMATDGNNIAMSKLSDRTYVIKDDSSSIALSSTHMLDKTANFCFSCDAICCSQRECDFSIYDEDSVYYALDDESESSDAIANAVDAIQKHASRLGMSEHELIEKVRQDRFI